MPTRPSMEPITINGLEIKNRIVRQAHGTEYGHGKVVPELIDYHVARAKGGVGLSILEVSSVHPSSWIDAIWSWDDSIVDGYRALTDAVRPFGMRMFSQLWHGGYNWPAADGSPSWAPSSVPSPWGAVPVAMTKAQIDTIVAAFAQSAVWSRDGGMDGIELHFGHGYLPTQFLSPLTNERDDEYGGSFENRARFLQEIARATRAAVGRDHPVGIRISDEFVAGGLSPDDCARVVRLLCDEELIDFVDASSGSYYSVQQMLPTMDMPTQSMLPRSRVIAAAANVPTMVCGRFQTLDDADQALRDNEADMVGLVRAMIADPLLITKTLAGEADQIRPCIGCNQGCVAGILSPAHRMLCTVNPAVGLEATLDEALVVPVQIPRRVLVVGGGPAGMEAARLAAMSGHRVTLAEAQSHLGGAIAIAARAPKARQIGDIAAWLEREIYRLGVDVRTSTYLDIEEIVAEDPDVVVVATGSTPRMDGRSAVAPGQPPSGVNLPHVRSSHEIFDVDRRLLGDDAVVFDSLGHYEAIGVAEHLVGLGLRVCFVTPLNAFAPAMEPPQRSAAALGRMRRAGRFTLMTRARLAAIAQGFCEVRDLDASLPVQVRADTVVLVSANRPNDGLLAGLRSINEQAGRPELKVIGDALAPRDLLVAITEGHKAGRFIA